MIQRGNECLTLCFTSCLGLFHSDECGFFGWACFTAIRITGHFWEYDHNVYRIDSGVGLFPKEAFGTS